jgi:uncharacterized NAD(P)/FAD-binding protein YdhS
MVTDGHHVLVVGGGAAGVITAATLLRRDTAVTVVEREAVAGPGLAYRTTDPLHLLNNYACRMSAVEDDPGHLVRWCWSQGLDVEAQTFLPRATYGRYLTSLLDDSSVPRGAAFSRVHDEVVDVTDTGNKYVATLRSGASITADVVVLALGNPPPRLPRGLDVDERRLVANPWVPDLVDRVADESNVLLVGTGLTTVDVTVRIASSRSNARLTAISRHGMLPLRHLPEPPDPAPSFDVRERTLGSVLAELRRCRSEGAQWRCLVESVKSVGNDLWHGLSLEEKERFVRHVGRYWEVSRHRMAPPMATLLDGLLSAGRLRVVAGGVEPTSYDLVVNCTGPAPVSTTGWSTLVDSLAAKGILRPDALGLGVDMDPEGALRDAQGAAARGIYAVGAARRGVDWEVAAVPDIRRQALRLTHHLMTPRGAEPVERLVG